MSISPSAGIFGAFLFGLFGSLSHCVAMCGGLAASVSGNPSHAALYHLGRITTYAFIGALVGATGTLAGFAGGHSETLRTAAALLAGVVMILTGISMLGSGSFSVERYVPSKWVVNRSAPLLRRSGAPSRLALGLVLGFLPCGLVYSAASYALAEGSIMQGAALLFAFGLGTIPALSGAAFLVRKGKQRIAWFRPAAALVLIASGSYYLIAGFPG